MLKRISIYLLLLFNIVAFSQVNPQWKGYFSYNVIKDISSSTSSFYAASENAVFNKDNSSNYLNTINSIDGFKPEVISTIYYSEQKKILFVGNTNGLLLLVFSDGRVVQKRGIIDEVPVSPAIKGINHFYEYESKIYISCDYGISVFDLNTLEFGDTYNIGNNGQYGKVFQTTVFNNEIYAVTQYDGLKKASISNPNLVDYNQWEVFNSGLWNGIVTFENQLILANYSNLVRYDGSQFITILSQSENINKLRVDANKIVIQTLNKVYVFNQTIQQIALIQSYQLTGLNATFSCASILGDTIYIGTTNKGVAAFSLSNLSNFEIIKPDGPERNRIFRLKKTSDILWATYGGYSLSYDPSLLQEAISKYSTETGWSKIPYEDLLGATSLTDIVTNPNNEKEVYVCSYHNGLLKIKDDQITLFNQTTSPPNGPQNQQFVTPTYISVRINGPAFDKSGNLWMTNAYVANGLKVLKSNNTWQSITDWATQLALPNEERYSKLEIDKNGTKWVPSYRGNGLIAFNENYSNKFIKIKTGTDGNLPETDIRCVALDNRNQLWIGTTRGLRIIQNVDQFLTEDAIQTKAIIILENDLAQELFYEQFIVDINVDGANRKWVSIADSGVYLVSSNGQETIYHFTKENSPLPSNNVNDIEIDGVTGEVYFATDKGLVSFKGSATKPSEDLSNVYVFPNPVRPEFDGTIKISGLTDKANVKITDVGGNLVYETTALGGTIEWDTTAFGKYKVASGVYMIFIAAEDGIETKVKKVMIVR
jgi:hypothetical protein